MAGAVCFAKVCTTSAVTPAIPPQLAEHYQHCLKLSAENKVSQKNAFNLQLIDWMAQAIGKKAKKTDGEVDINDFQVRGEGWWWWRGRCRGSGGGERSNLPRLDLGHRHEQLYGEAAPPRRVKLHDVDYTEPRRG